MLQELSMHAGGLNLHGRKEQIQPIGLSELTINLPPRRITNDTRKQSVFIGIHKLLFPETIGVEKILDTDDI
jgi:hypothetical protein